MTKIGIDASFLRKQNTGIGQVSVNFIKKLIELENKKLKFHKVELVEFFLYLEEDIDLKMPANFHKRIFLPPYKRDDLIRKIWWEKFSLPKKIRRDECDVFLSLYQSTTVLPKTIKHLMVVHDIIPKLFSHYLNNWRKVVYQKLVEKAIRKVDRIVTVSHRSEKDLINHLGIDSKKITVSYIDVDEIYKKEITLEECRKVLGKYDLRAGYVYHGGGLEVRKNAESVIRAYKLLLYGKHGGRKIPKLVISGKLMPQLAPLVTDVEKLVKELGLDEQVITLGYVPQADLPAIYKSASMFVYPSFYEGFGLPVLEAMNQGVPVVSAKTSSLPEVGSDSVLYCDPNDVEDIAMVMKNIFSNKHLQLALALKGKERAKHFSWEKFTRKLINIVNEMKQ